MALLKGAKQVRITTREGTDLTFSMGDRLVFADDGVLSAEEKNSQEMFARFASLPGGWMDFAPLESSVNGKVVIPQARCAFEPMKGITFEVKNGVMQNFNASYRGDCYEKEMAPHTGAKSTVSIFTIGLNPEVKVIQNEKTDYRENIAAGYISLAVGANNKPYRGVVAATGGFTFPLVNATLQIDGAVVIKDGKVL
jgi:leucyl aminopeptidase (aminopeptidase T)